MKSTKNWEKIMLKAITGECEKKIHLKNFRRGEGWSRPPSKYGPGSDSTFWLDSTLKLQSTVLLWALFSSFIEAVAGQGHWVSLFEPSNCFSVRSRRAGLGCDGESGAHFQTSSERSSFWLVCCYVLTCGIGYVRSSGSQTFLAGR